MTDDELELSILEKYVTRHKEVETVKPQVTNKCAYELDMREVLHELTGEEGTNLDYSAGLWIGRLAPQTPGASKGPLRPCSNGSLNTSDHKYHARAFTDPVNDAPAPAWERIRELQEKVSVHRPVATTKMKKPKELRTAFSIYAIKDSIGQGNSGIVYKAINDNGESVAIKILDPAKVSREKLKRFENEYRFCSNNRHPNIIRVLDHGLTDDGTPFFVMPLYDESLRKLIGNLEVNQSFSIFMKMLDGIEAAHMLGVVHRDLKPENILVRNIGKELVITDFGISSFEEEELFTAVETKDGTRLANFQYPAPEQRARDKEVDRRADIYALGLMLNELFTSELAHGTNYKKIGSVSPDYSYLDIIVDRMLRQDPSSRYQSIEKIKKELISRGAEHISRQKVSKLKKTVISTTEVDDPLINDPMRIIDVGWKDNMLTIILNHPVNEKWIWALNNMGTWSALLGKNPINFEFYGNKVHIHAESRQTQQVIDHFNEWLPKANKVYADKIKHEQEEAERKEREELQRRIKMEEERSDVLRKLKF
jgi:serine/threonine protein kinase